MDSRHRSLPPGMRQRYVNEWNALHARFTQIPVETLRDAERLVGSILRDLGFAFIEASARPDALLADHPLLAERYREARDVMARLDDGTRVTLDDLREALAAYGTVVAGLLEPV